MSDEFHVIVLREDEPMRWPPIPAGECPHGPHRGPQGPDEDLSQCPQCWSASWTFRAEGDSSGEYLPYC
ncbi:hypothetical protein LWC33_04490 [Pseudonocardia sp. RS11V-5]|uniref:hypothetical protein n=1 Tax=Pseudonocardia terrae TaxID=2905831 RepID=UPI001E605836|nr:hypothetical protein [Pseudonocardia terrae]MCE3550713.1 hypothetical protein [Pseudonocardia terrae]